MSLRISVSLCRCLVDLTSRSFEAFGSSVPWCGEFSPPLRSTSESCFGICGGPNPGPQSPPSLKADRSKLKAVLVARENEPISRTRENCALGPLSSASLPAERKLQYATSGFAADRLLGLDLSRYVLEMLLDRTEIVLQLRQLRNRHRKSLPDLRLAIGVDFSSRLDFSDLLVDHGALLVQVLQALIGSVVEPTTKSCRSSRMTLKRDSVPKIPTSFSKTRSK